MWLSSSSQWHIKVMFRRPPSVFGYPQCVLLAVNFLVSLYLLSVNLSAVDLSNAVRAMVTGMESEN